MTVRKPSQGLIPFHVPAAGKPCETWYKIVGDLRHGIPLILAHGGPGGGHEYLLPFTDLHEKYGKTVIFYDQIGCGKSTRLREKAGDEEFWTVELFVEELDNLVDFLGLRSRGFDYLGQSWGGMLGTWITKTPNLSSDNTKLFANCYQAAYGRPVILAGCAK